MFSKAEAQEIKKEFWISFAEAYPRKWLLYDTKIKDVSFKFYVDNKKAKVMLDIEPKETEKRKIYYNNLLSLKGILRDEYLSEAVFQEDYYLENGKAISRVWVEIEGISLYNKASWAMIFRFFSLNMDAFERFFEEYNDIVRNSEKK